MILQAAATKNGATDEGVVVVFGRSIVCWLAAVATRSCHQQGTMLRCCDEMEEVLSRIKPASRCSFQPSPSSSSSARASQAATPPAPVAGTAHTLTSMILRVVVTVLCISLSAFPDKSAVIL